MNKANGPSPNSNEAMNPITATTQAKGSHEA